MSKNRRGKPLRSIPGRTRGTCPICSRTGIKLSYEKKANDKTYKVCKNCRNLDSNRIEA